jgi:hypothetical protein
MSYEESKLREELIRAVLRRVLSERADESSPNYAAELEYCDDMIDEAAKKLTMIKAYGG